ncbi:MAG: cysteine desulfurase [Oscillospiraceae bacterium]|nr:cysteine desulfurase [Oscillospiraceae bacterium]
MEIYLDNAATTRVCPEAAEAAAAAMLENYGNPSSTHAKGRAARELVEKARRQTAAPLGAKSGEIVFTSGGSESDNWALRGAAEAQKRRGRHIISSEAEHDAVRQTLLAMHRDGWEVTLLAPGPDGAVTPEAVAAALREDTVLVSLMLVNNETGAVTDIAGVSRVLREAKSAALLHTDAVQAYGKLGFTARGLGADLISISGHKIHAPKGIGALYIRQGLRLPPLILGGGQENGLRAGTEPVPQIAAFGAAAALAAQGRAESAEHMAALRRYCVERLSAALPEAVFIPGGAAHILSLSLPGYRSEVLMNYLEREGIYVSRSSACKRGRRSHVLEAMGLPDRVIDGALRVSFSRYTTAGECEAFCQALLRAKDELRPALH